MLKRFLTAVLFSALSTPGAHGADVHGVGFKKLIVSDPVDHRQMDAVAFFPGAGQNGVTTIGPYQIAASGSAAVEKGIYPLILLSHGNMGSLLGHHDLATGLARRGFMVVSVNHPGDNYRDASRVGTTSAIYGRPLQISAALTAALKDPVLGPHIASDRIGFIGFSAGGTTGLILAGGKPTLARLADYCAARPDDRHVCEARGEIRNDRPELAPAADPRIRAFVLLAPLSVVFSPDALKSLRAPLRVFVGDKDEELSPGANAITLAEDSGAALTVIADGGHYTFLSPCSAEMSRAQPELCHDEKGVDRVAVHQQLIAETADFFNAKLGEKSR